MSAFYCNKFEISINIQDSETISDSNWIFDFGNLLIKQFDAKMRSNSIKIIKKFLKWFLNYLPKNSFEIIFEI